MTAPARPSSGRQNGQALWCSDLVVRYGSRVAVNGLTFHAEAGEVVTLLGPNGAGKTSTVETLEGYRIPDGGQVRMLGLDPAGQHRALVPRIGVMLQRGGVYPMLSPRRAIDLFASYYDNPEPTEALLELIDLRSSAHTPWRHLSGGEQQRLSLALALVGRPELVLLDEPTSGVDPHGRVAIRQVVTDLKERGACVLLTTHELTEAERLSDRVIVLRAGTLVAEGSPTELAASTAAPMLRFVSRPRLDVVSLSEALGASVTEERPGEYVVRAVPTPQLTAAITAWLAERDVHLKELRTEQTLEETYLNLVGETGEQAPHDQGSEEKALGDDVHLRRTSGIAGGRGRRRLGRRRRS